MSAYDKNIAMTCLKICKNSVSYKNMKSTPDHKKKEDKFFRKKGAESNGKK